MSRSQRVTILLIVCIAIWTNKIFGLPTLPVLDESSGIDNATIEELQDSVNASSRNLYVVRAVVYEVGILTDEDDNDTHIDSHERVDLTFFDAHVNDSHIDLGRIPLPIQTNVSGQVLTGIAPINIGAFSHPSELVNSLPLTGTIVNLTHSDTAFFQLTAKNKTDDDGPQILSKDELVHIPEVANAFPSS